MAAHLSAISVEPTHKAGYRMRYKHQAQPSIKNSLNSAKNNSNSTQIEIYSGEGPAKDLLLSALVEMLPEGFMVISRSMRVIYWNSKAKELCQYLSGSDRCSLELPNVVSEACYRVIRGRDAENPVVTLDCKIGAGPTVRIQANWLALNNHLSERSQQHQLILVRLEDQDAALRQELRIEQEKYDLTEREAEIWILLRQEYTYQEIAKTLQISLNTVKTHVKNVYAKRRSSQGDDRAV